MNRLQGKRVLVTRPPEQAGELAEKLAAHGALPLLFPTIQIAPPPDPALLDRAIAELDAYRWVIFTSVNGVAAFWERLTALGQDARALRHNRVAAIGPATAAALRERGRPPDLIPDEFIAEAILPGLGEVRGQRILLPRADIARRTLADELRARGALPEEIPAYRTLIAQPDPQAFAALEAGVDVATFTSSSTVRNFVALLGEWAREVLQGAVVVCIGPVTAETARANGLTVDLVAAEYTVDGLVEALLDYFQPAIS